MDIAGLASSQFPNALALGLLVLMAVIAWAIHDKTKKAFWLIAAGEFGVILIKNVSYLVIIEMPHAENSEQARHDYSALLFGVVFMQFLLAVVLLAVCTQTTSMRWSAVACAVACAYAGLTALGWNQAYLHMPSQPVHYELMFQPLHWAALVCIIVVLIIDVVLAVRRLTRRPRKRT